MSAIFTMITPAIAEAIHTFNRSYPVTVNPPVPVKNMIVINKQVAWLVVNVVSLPPLLALLFFFCILPNS